MSRFRMLGMFAVVVALMGFQTIRAQEAAKSHSHAVVVGVGTFADKEIKGRPSADSDAKAIAAVLKDKAVGGLPADNITLLLSNEGDGAKKGTKANILQAIEDAVKKVGKEDTLIVYMVMQGATAGEKPCLFATDSTFKDRAKDAIFAGDIEQKLKDLKSEQFSVYLDLFLKAYESKESILAPNVNEFVRVFMGVKEKDDAEPPVGRSVFLYGSGVQPPLVSGDQGVFTKAISDGLKGKADNDGYEPDGIVTLEELRKYTDKAAVDLAREVGKSNEDKLPRMFYVGRAYHYPVSRNPGAADKAEARVAKFKELQKTLDKEIAADGTKVLARMPRLKALQDLRKSYQKFADGDLTAEQLKNARERIMTSMKLAEDDAKTYADKVLEGLVFVRNRYIKKLELGEMVAAGIKGMFRVTETTVPDDLKERLGKTKDLSNADLKTLLQEARLTLGKREDLDEGKDVEIAMNTAMRKFVDDYTTYIAPQKVEETEKDLTGNFTGIGVQIRRDIARDALLVVTPIKGSPAYKAGLLTGDLLTEIILETDNQGMPLDKPNTVSTKGMDTTDAVKLIIGKPGTKVKVKIERDGVKEPMVKEITRGRVEVESVYGYKRNEKDDSWDYYVDPKNKIAYIHLTQFARNSAIDVQAAIEKLSKDGVKGVVFDVRFNPGGYLDVAVTICDTFIDDGVIVSVRPGNSRANERSIKGMSRGSFLDFPMVCLVNEGSASGSEILAGCLQDHGRAVIMGERSFGKGSVQNVENFPLTGGKIKLTTATFWPPSGRNLNKASTSGKDEEDWGVRPDKGYELKLERAEKDELFDRIYNWGVIPRRDAPTKEKTKEFKDRQLEMAVDYLRSQIKVSRKD